MKLSGLLNKPREALPGVTGPGRVDRRTDELLRRVEPGDIAVLDQLDLDRRTADALVSAEVAGVVNAAPSTSGRFPNLGPEVLVAAGIPLVDGLGGDVLRGVKDGSKLRLWEGTVYLGEKVIGVGTEQTPESVADAMIEAKEGMSAQLEAFSANTIEFLRRERTLILDGVGVPELRVDMADREVLAVGPGSEHREDLGSLKRYIAEHRPVLVGIDQGADTLCELGYAPTVIVGDPYGIGVEALSRASEVVVPAHADGYAPGVERIQDLGIGAVTFAASGNPEDLALLLADAHGASLIVTVGFEATLREFLDRGRSGSNPSTFLTRLRLGGKLVDGKAVATLHRSRVSTLSIVLLGVSALLVVLAALVSSDLGRVYLDWLVRHGSEFVTMVQGVFT
jgi:uncharacterized membrane-anchored protein